MRWRDWMAAACLCLLGMAGPVWADDARDSQACLECHDEEDMPDWRLGAHMKPARKPPMERAAQALRRTPMGDLADARIPHCTTCHGASPTHVKKPADVKERPKPDRTYGKAGSTTIAQRNDICQSCHARDSRNAHWSGSQHQAADVACTSCHKVHVNHDKVLAKATQTEVCVSCHKEQRAHLSKPSRHPVPEGKMACSDCHNVHGSAGPKLAKKDSTNDTCYSCHTEKRGPFVHQHEPVTDDCSNCHNPHGSTVAGMLKARPPLLCQQCHTPHVVGGVGALAGQPGVRTLAAGQVQPLVNSVTGGKNVVNMWQGRSCLNCHTQVHGSNNPSATQPGPRLQLR